MKLIHVHGYDITSKILKEKNKAHNSTLSKLPFIGYVSLLL